MVVGFGGYVALPAYLAARRLVSRTSCTRRTRARGWRTGSAPGSPRYVAVSVPGTVDQLPHAALVGIPLRRSIATLDRAHLRTKARLAFGLDAERPTLLVFGGSQGARSINEAVRGAARRLLDSGVQVLHAAGPQNTWSSTVSPTTRRTSCCPTSSAWTWPTRPPTWCSDGRAR